MLRSGRLRLRTWSPRLLNPALWLEARAETMFSSNAASGGVSDTGTVGYWRDLSVNGFDISSAADDTTRPTWNVNSGRPYVNFDGSNDVLLRTADLGMYAAGACAIYLAFRGTPLATSERLISSGSSAANNQVYVPVQSLGGSPATTSSAFVRNDAGTQLVDPAIAIQALALDSTDRVFGIEDNGSSLTPYLDRVAGTPAAYTRSGTFTFNRFGLGALVRAASANFASARIYALVVVNRLLTPSERASLTRYMGARAGLSF